MTGFCDVNSKEIELIPLTISQSSRNLNGPCPIDSALQEQEGNFNPVKDISVAAVNDKQEASFIVHT